MEGKERTPKIYVFRSFAQINSKIFSFLLIWIQISNLSLLHAENICLFQVIEGPLLNFLSSIKEGLKMYIIEDKGGAIAVMLASLLFLGTWPAVLTLLERRGRLPQHTYLDYSITNLLAAVLIALTFGQLGESKPNMPNFFTQLSQVSILVII